MSNNVQYRSPRVTHSCWCDRCELCVRVESVEILLRSGLLSLQLNDLLLERQHLVLQVNCSSGSSLQLQVRFFGPLLQFLSNVQDNATGWMSPLESIYVGTAA